MTKRITIEKVIVVRALHDIAPKVVAAGLGGLTATEVLNLLQLVHISLPLSAATLLVTVVSAVCGWIKADTVLLPELDKANAEIASEPAAAVVDQALAAVQTAVHPTVTQG